MVAIVLAAGYATRLYPITLNTPKALLEIGGKPMLEHIIDKIVEIGAVSKTAIISNHKFYDQFVKWEEKYSARHSGAGAGPKIEILNDGTVSEEDRLGAIGDISFALGALSIDDEIIIIAGDNFFTFRLIDLYSFYKRKDADCIVVKKAADRRALRNLGVAILDPDFRVVDFEEKPPEPKSDYGVYATYIYKRETLPLFKTYLDEGNPKDAPGNFPAWLCKRKRVVAYAFDGDCYDIGTPQAYEEVCGKFQR